MPDPRLEEFCRAHTLQTHIFRGLQRYVRETIQPQLDERETLLVENADLKAKLEQLQQKAARKKSEAAA